MPVRELTIILETDEDLPYEKLKEIGRDASVKILELHGIHGYSRRGGAPVVSVRMMNHTWNSVRYPGEGREWAILDAERERYDYDEEDYDDDDEDDDF